MNKYLRKSAVKMAEAVCNILNQFSLEESAAFRQELLSAIQSIRFDGKEWIAEEE